VVSGRGKAFRWRPVCASHLACYRRSWPFLAFGVTFCVPRSRSAPRLPVTREFPRQIAGGSQSGSQAVPASRWAAARDTWSAPGEAAGHGDGGSDAVRTGRAMYRPRVVLTPDDSAPAFPATRTTAGRGRHHASGRERRG
jgi:hypothetical protein